MGTLGVLSQKMSQSWGRPSNSPSSFPEMTLGLGQAGGWKVAPCMKLEV